MRHESSSPPEPYGFVQGPAPKESFDAFHSFHCFHFVSSPGAAPHRQTPHKLPCQPACPPKPRMPLASLPCPAWPALHSPPGLLRAGPPRSGPLPCSQHCGLSRQPPGPNGFSDSPEISALVETGRVTSPLRKFGRLNDANNANAATMRLINI